jgi:hypothetical protein
VRCNPKMMMMTPAILLMSARCLCNAWPTVVAAAPRARKTIEKPRMNIKEFRKTLRIRRESCSLSSSTLAPEISDTYPGTRGRTQGERNEINPARNAAIGRGSEDIGAALIVTIPGYLDAPGAQTCASHSFCVGLNWPAQSSHRQDRTESLLLSRLQRRVALHDSQTDRRGFPQPRPGLSYNDGISRVLRIIAD